jgi:hypothetical protein
VGADLPDEADVPPDGRADRRDDQTGSGQTARRPGGSEAETRSRQECYDELRVAEAKQQSVAAQRIAAEEQAASDTWNEKATESRWMWTEYQRKWPPEERKPSGKPDGPPGTWHGEGNRVLEPADNDRVEAECDRIANASETRSPQRCAPWKAKTPTATWSASTTAGKTATASKRRFPE